MHYHVADKNGSGFLQQMQTLAGFMAVTKTPFVDGGIRKNLAQTVVNIPEREGSDGITNYLDKVVSQMLSVMVKRLREVLSKYVTVTMTSITGLIPEFVYYVRLAEFIENMKSEGMHFCRASIIEGDNTADVLMRARGVYNLKLASADIAYKDIVTNDLDFSRDHMVYILTGANRGGKTTITQGIGILFVMAQGGIHVPGDSFELAPVDCIYTHFPADEDKTMDLGRLGEECIRFKKMYTDCTDKSLMLLNETFSTTSFEEGYYIARDAVKALLAKGVRTIYNTHMHKLAQDVGELNRESSDSKAVSLIVRSDGGQRSFKVEVAEPEGMSYARDIAKKYGVTYEMLTGEDQGEHQGERQYKHQGEQ
jgi:DNA mismatch repair ATPase MutS